MKETAHQGQDTKRLKVVLAITKSNWGGAQRYVFDIATGLAPHIYDVTVIAGGEGRLIDKLKEASVKTISVDTLKRDIGVFKDLRSFISFVRIIRRERPDILHSNSSKMGLFGALAGRITGVPRIIFTAHGWAFTEERRRFEKIMFFLAHYLTVIMYHITITVSEETKSYIQSDPIISKKLRVIHNGIEIPELLNREESRSMILSALPKDTQDKILKDGALWIGTISELHPNKGLTFALQALSIQDQDKNRTNKSVFMIIATGELEARLRAEATELGIDDRVFFLGYIPNASIYLKAFDVFTLTSITEGLPYVLLEAGAAGLPVVASAVGGIGEIITDMKSGILIQPRQPKEIAAALSFYETRPDTRLEFGASLQENVRKNFLISYMREKTYNLYIKR